MLPPHRIGDGWSTFTRIATACLGVRRFRGQDQSCHGRQSANKPGESSRELGEQPRACSAEPPGYHCDSAARPSGNLSFSAGCIRQRTRFAVRGISEHDAATARLLATISGWASPDNTVGLHRGVCGPGELSSRSPSKVIERVFR